MKKYLNIRIQRNMMHISFDETMLYGEIVLKTNKITPNNPICIFFINPPFESFSFDFTKYQSEILCLKRRSYSSLGKSFVFKLFDRGRKNKFVKRKEKIVSKNCIIEHLNEGTILFDIKKFKLLDRLKFATKKEIYLNLIPPKSLYGNLQISFDNIALYKEMHFSSPYNQMSENFESQNFSFNISKIPMDKQLCLVQHTGFRLEQRSIVHADDYSAVVVSKNCTVLNHTNNGALPRFHFDIKKIRMLDRVGRVMG